MTEVLIAGTEVVLTARIEEDGAISLEWTQIEEDGRLSARMTQRFLFHEDWVPMLRKSREHDGMIELVRVRVDADALAAFGHVEPLLTETPDAAD